MSKEEILKSKEVFGYLKTYPEWMTQQILKAMEEYASLREQAAFEAAREDVEIRTDVGDEFVEYIVTPKYPTLEDYLKNRMK